MSSTQQNLVVPLLLHPSPPNKPVFYFSKWVTFSAACLVMLSAGLPYSFSVYGPTLQRTLDLSQTAISGVGSAGNVGGYLAIFAGLFYDLVRKLNRMGPKLTILIGAACYGVGFIGLNLVVKKVLPESYALVLFLAVIANNGGCWLETAALVTTVRNFETERGTVIGVLKSFLGLSASFYTSIYQGFLAPRSVKFLLLLGTIPGTASVFLSTFINYVPFIQYERHLKSHAFHIVYAVVIGFAGYQLVYAANIMQSEQPKVANVQRGAIQLAAMIALLFPVLALTFIFGGLFAEPFYKNSARDQDDHLGDQIDNGNQRTSVQDYNLVDCIQSGRYWLMFVISGVISGAGLVFINNLGQIVHVLGGDQGTQNSYVSLFSVANCIGRLLSGFIPDRIFRKSGVPRTFFIVQCCILCTISSIVNAFFPLNLLIVSALLSGAAFGVGQGLIPSTTSDLFGVEHFASNYAFMQLALTIGSYGMATAMSGYMYQFVGQQQNLANDEDCLGKWCFGITFLLTAGMCVIATLLSILLYINSRELYHELKYVLHTQRKRRGVKAKLEIQRKALDDMIIFNQEVYGILSQGQAQLKIAQKILKNRDDSKELEQCLDVVDDCLCNAGDQLQYQMAATGALTRLPSFRRRTIQ